MDYDPSIALVVFCDVCSPPSLSSLLPTYRCYPFFRPFTRAVSFYAVTVRSQVDITA